MKGLVNHSKFGTVVVTAMVAATMLADAPLLAQAASDKKAASPQAPLPPPLPPAPAARVAPQGPPIKIVPRAAINPSTGAPQSVVVRPGAVTPAAPARVSLPANFVGPQLPPPPSRPPTVIAPIVQGPVPTNVLTWDAESKTVEVKPGEIEAKFTFYFTNVSSSEVSINALRPSCGCTAAKLPETPWKIAPGQGGLISAVMNVQGAVGFKTKGLTVDTSAGTKFLTLMAKLPDTPAVTAVNNTTGAPQNMQRTEAERSKNLQTALSDRQAPLKGDCAKCHVEPALGKQGKELYMAACAICHNAERRAPMVVDLQDPKYKTNSVPEFWNLFVTMGKPGTLMPAFAKEHGGFMTPDQVSSLVHYLSKEFPKEDKIVYRETSMEPAVVTPAASNTVTTSSFLPAPLGTFAVPDGGK